jgi:hypothetical protein
VGVCRIVVSAKYMGETKTYDKPAFNFVRWTADQDGEQITIDDPDVDVEIEVSDVSSSLLDEAIRAAFTAAEEAVDAKGQVLETEAEVEAAEALRVSAEESRVEAEEGRAEAEAARVDEEAVRVSAEDARVVAENARAAAEDLREGAEDDRAAAETARETAEAARVAAEALRVTAEGSRETAEAAREAQASADHTTAASDHTQAAADHTQAAADHTTAASDHTQAGADHTLAAADHVTAGEDHAQAQDDHEVMAGYDTRLGNVEGEVSQLEAKVTDLDYCDTASVNIAPGSYNKNGTLDTEDTTWLHSIEYTPVKNGDIIVWYGGNTVDYTHYNRKLLLYDSERKFLDYYGYTEQDRQITLSDPGVAYIRASFKSGSQCTLYINGVPAFIPRFEKEIFANQKAASNLYANITENNKEFIRPNVENGYLSDTGSVVSASGWCHNSYFIPVKSGDTIIWRGGSQADTNKRMVIYNASFLLLDSYGYTETNRQIASFPNSFGDVVYIRASFKEEEGCGITVNGVSVFDVCLRSRSIFDIDADVEELKNSGTDFDVVTYENEEVIRTERKTQVFPNAASESFVYESDQNYPIQFARVSKGDTMRVFASNTEAKNFRWGLSENIPEVGGHIHSITERLGVTSVDDTIICDIDGYIFFYCFKISFVDATITKLSSAKTTQYVPRMSYIPVCGLIQRIPNVNWSTSPNAYGVCTSAMLVPYYACCLHFILPSTIKCKLQYGNIVSGSSTSQFSDYLENGDSFLIPDKVANIRLTFYKQDDSAITSDEVDTFVSEGKLAVWYENRTNDVVKKNIGCETYTKAVMFKKTDNSVSSYLHNIPVFAHFSDSHGDLVRVKNILEYCKYLGVDFVVNTGDTVCNKIIDGTETYHAIVGSYPFPTLICVGNHDDWVLDDESEGTQNEKIYRSLINPNSGSFGYVLPSSSDYDSAPTYYYRDFSSQKLRVITINQYEEGIYDWSTYGRISKKQIDWFISVLLSTPADYGVIISEHINTDGIVMVQGFGKFYQQGRGIIETNLSGDPIRKIVDAFISKTTVSGQYTQKIDNNGEMAMETITYQADFSGVNTGVEFICHLNGHHHSDVVGIYANATNRQLCLNITTAQSLYGFIHFWKANDGDVPRGGMGACEDAFNVYGIDRESGTVRIARVGANVTSGLEMRDYLIIPYRT